MSIYDHNKVELFVTAVLGKRAVVDMKKSLRRDAKRANRRMVEHVYGCNYRVAARQVARAHRLARAGLRRIWGAHDRWSSLGQLAVTGPMLRSMSGGGMS